MKFNAFSKKKITSVDKQHVPPGAHLRFKLGPYQIKQDCNEEGWNFFFLPFQNERLASYRRRSAKGTSLPARWQMVATPLMTDVYAYTPSILVEFGQDNDMVSKT